MRSSLIQLAEARAVKVKIKTVFIFIQWTVFAWSQNLTN